MSLIKLKEKHKDFIDKESHKVFINQRKFTLDKSKELFSFCKILSHVYFLLENYWSFITDFILSRRGKIFFGHVDPANFFLKIFFSTRGKFAKFFSAPQ